MTYANEIDPFAAEWLGNLFPVMTIDTRSIKDVATSDLVRFTRCHFFAGLCGWEHALDLAGWPADRPVWTGSCPCQPYSAAGKQKGDADERNLWPDFFRLIRECRPDTIFGEQVSSAIGHGWLDGVQRDLESEGYTVGHCVLGAHSVGSPHIRQRLFWVADKHSHQRSGKPLVEAGTRERRSGPSDGGSDGGLADGSLGGRGIVGDASFAGSGGHAHGGGEPDLACWTQCECWAIDEWAELGIDPYSCRLGEPILARFQGHAGDEFDGDQPGRIIAGAGGPVAATSAWADSIAIPCGDGKSRRISAQPGSFPLAYGFPRNMGPFVTWLERMGHDAKSARTMVRAASRNRTGRLRGYGNAIVPQVAAVFIRAFLEATTDQ